MFFSSIVVFCSLCWFVFIHFVFGFCFTFWWKKFCAVVREDTEENFFGLTAFYLLCVWMLMCWCLWLKSFSTNLLWCLAEKFFSFPSYSLRELFQGTLKLDWLQFGWNVFLSSCVPFWQKNFSAANNLFELINCPSSWLPMWKGFLIRTPSLQEIIGNCYRLCSEFRVISCSEGV